LATELQRTIGDGWLLPVAKAKISGSWTKSNWSNKDGRPRANEGVTDDGAACGIAGQCPNPAKCDWKNQDGEQLANDALF